MEYEHSPCQQLAKLISNPYGIFCREVILLYLADLALSNEVRNTHGSSHYSKVRVILLTPEL